MKNFKNYLSFLVVFALFFTSCSKDDAGTDKDASDNVATLTFASVLADFNKTNKQSDVLPECSSDTPAFAEISLTYGPADTEVNVVVPIMMDSDGYFTAFDDNLEIPVPSGQDWVSISLNEFNVWNDVNGAPGDIIWKAPMEGSEFEGFVSDALPMEIDLRAGSKNYVDVEVLCFDDRVVNKYGYQFFDITFEELRTLCFFANYCTNEGRHFTANYDLDLYYYTGDNTEVTPEMSDLEVLYANRSPQVGLDGNDYYADPLCLAIPEPQMGESADKAYLYYEVTLTEWNGNYTLPGESIVHTGFLTWNDIKALLDTDEDGDIENNTDADYWHVQLNCDSDDGGTGNDADNDTIPDSSDNCPSTANTDQADDDNDGIGNVCDACPSQAGPATNNGCPQSTCNTSPVCSLDTSGDTEADFCNVTSLAGSTDGWIKVNGAGEWSLVYTDDLQDVITVGKVEVNLTGNVLEVTLDTPEGVDNINATDHFKAYAIEVRPSLEDGSMSECREGACDSNLEEYGAIEKTFSAVTYGYPVYVKVSTVSCFTPVE